MNKSTFLIDHKSEKQNKLKEKELGSTPTLLLAPKSKEEQDTYELLDQIGLTKKINREREKVKSLEGDSVLMDKLIKEYNTTIHRRSDIEYIQTKYNLYFCPTSELDCDLPPELVKGIKEYKDNNKEVRHRADGEEYLIDKITFTSNRFLVLTDSLKSPKSISLYYAVDSNHGYTKSAKYFALISASGGNYSDARRIAKYFGSKSNLTSNITIFIFYLLFSFYVGSSEVPYNTTFYLIALFCVLSTISFIYYIRSKDAIIEDIETGVKTVLNESEIETRKKIFKVFYFLCIFVVLFQWYNGDKEVIYTNYKQTPTYNKKSGEVNTIIPTLYNHGLNPDTPYKFYKGTKEINTRSKIPFIFNNVKDYTTRSYIFETTKGKTKHIVLLDENK